MDATVEYTKTKDNLRLLDESATVESWLVPNLPEKKLNILTSNLDLDGQYAEVEILFLLSNQEKTEIHWTIFVEFILSMEAI